MQFYMEWTASCCADSQPGCSGKNKPVAYDTHNSRIAVAAHRSKICLYMRRAEATDVVNAVLHGVDCIRLF